MGKMLMHMSLAEGVVHSRKTNRNRPENLRRDFSGGYVIVPPAAPTGAQPTHLPAAWQTIHVLEKQEEGASSYMVPPVL